MATVMMTKGKVNKLRKRQAKKGKVQVKEEVTKMNSEEMNKGSQEKMKKNEETKTW